MVWAFFRNFRKIEKKMRKKGLIFSLPCVRMDFLKVESAPLSGAEG